MWVQQPRQVLDDSRTWPPQQDNIICGIHLHNSISGWVELSQDSWLWIPLFQLWNTIPCEYSWHLSGDRVPAHQASRGTVLVCIEYDFEQYQLTDTAAMHSDCPKLWLCESCQMQKLIAQSSLPQEAEYVYSTTNWSCSSRCIFGQSLSLGGTSVLHLGPCESRDVT